MANNVKGFEDIELSEDEFLSEESLLEFEDGRGSDAPEMTESEKEGDSPCP